jgi:hypothetical protein
MGRRRLWRLEEAPLLARTKTAGAWGAGRVSTRELSAYQKVAADRAKRGVAAPRNALTLQKANCYS